jgi:hypothetical protein
MSLFDLFEGKVSTEVKVGILTVHSGKNEKVWFPTLAPPPHKGRQYAWQEAYHLQGQDSIQP